MKADKSCKRPPPPKVMEPRRQRLALKAVSENHNGYYEVAVVSIWGSPRIYDFWSPPKENSKELCERFIERLEVAAAEIIDDLTSATRSPSSGGRT